MFFIFYFIKSETSDSFVNHFDGHFAYLKTLDFKGSSPKLCTKSVTCHQNPKLQINLSTLTASEQVSGLWKQTKQHNMLLKCKEKWMRKGINCKKATYRGTNLSLTENVCPHFCWIVHVTCDFELNEQTKSLLTPSSQECAWPTVACILPSANAGSLKFEEK